MAKPSKISEWLLKRFSMPGQAFSVLGDFEEIYVTLVEEKGILRAKAWYWWQIYLAFFPYVRFYINRSKIMMKNYFKIAVRNLKRHKIYSLINISGLAIGIACCILIMLFVQYELSYDTYHENADRIFRVSREWFNPNGSTSLHAGHVAPPAGPLLLEEFPDIEMMVRITAINSIVNYDGKSFREKRFFAVDEDVFKMFSWKLLKGDPASVLQKPNTVVISESMAQKYFEGDDPLGKMLNLNTSEVNISVLVTGVMEDTPDNSHGHFDFFMSMESLNQAFPDFMRTSWGSNNWSTYVLLPEHYDVKALEEKMPEFMNRHLNDPFARTTLNFWKLTDIHLHSNLDSEIEANSDIMYVYTLSVVAIFILLIACCNFMNLSTARSTNRAKEVGLRKVVGAYRNQLISQFLSESVIMAIVSMVFALGIVVFALPVFRNFVDRPLEFNLFANLQLFGGLAAIMVFIGIVAGSYPAFFLSAFRPAAVLKGEKGSNSKSAMFRSLLAASQFAISIVLLIGMGVVGDQLDFIMNKRLGYDKEHLINFTMSTPMRAQQNTVKAEIIDAPAIVSASLSSRIPTGRLNDSVGGRLENENIEFRLAYVSVDLDFLDTFGMEMAAGRSFSTEFTTDTSNSFIINETAAKKIGWTNVNSAVGQTLVYGSIKGKVIGVVKDFHFESLKSAIVPIIFLYRGEYFGSMTVRVKPGQVEDSIAFLEDLWNRYNPGIPFDYHFVDEKFEELYTSEKKLGQIFGSFSILAIIIAGLGLFGLASFTVERRVKEIGIRKVLGANIEAIASLIAREFAGLLLVANIVAWPAAYFALNTWFLRSFAYRVDLNIMTFVISGAAACLVALLPVSIQAMKAAILNPIHSLRSE